MTQTRYFQTNPQQDMRPRDLIAIEREAHQMRSEAIREGFAVIHGFFRRRLARQTGKPQHS